jgi:hypothetical protein
MWFIMGGMTGNPFSTENLLPVWKRASEILKGDTEGHPFRGNQWTDKANEVSDRHANVEGEFEKVSDVAKEGAEWSKEHAGEITPDEPTLRSVAKLHDAIAEAHGENSIRTYHGVTMAPWDEIDKSFPGHEDAYYAHDKVVKTASDLADKVASGGKVGDDEMADLRNKINEAENKSDLSEDREPSEDDYY